MTRIYNQGCVLLILGLLCPLLHGGGEVQVPLPLAARIVSIETTDLDIGQGRLAFDGDASTLIRTPSINPAFVRVAFDAPITFEHIRLHLIEEKHEISIFAADSLEDLKEGAGSCRVLARNLPAKGARVEVPLEAPVTAQAFELEVHRLTGDDYVHIAEWSFCRPGKVDRLCIRRVTDRRRADAEEGLDEAEGVVKKPVFTVVWFKAHAESGGSRLDIAGEVEWEALDPGIEPFGSVPGQFLIKEAGTHRVRARYGRFEKTLRLEGMPRTIRNQEPDIEIWYIERLPRLDFDGPNGGWPAPGDPVTWRGHVYNWGRKALKVRYEWILDGEPAGGGEAEIPPGPPGLAAETIDLPLRWEKKRQDLTLRVIPPEEVLDLVPQNNELTIQTDAVTVGFWVERSLFDFHHEHQRLLPCEDANSFAGWSQRMMRQWNRMFGEAVYPEYPEGILERVRLDRLVIVPDFSLPLAGGIPSNNPDLRDRSVDMTWGHEAGDLADLAEVPESHWWSPERAVKAFENGDIERRKTDPPFWCGLGYIHEMAHARYLIDAYGFNVHSGTSPDVSDRAIRVQDEKGPILGRYMRIEDDIQHWRKYPGQMGGDYWSWSVYEAMCWNRVQGRRARGGNCNAPPNIGEFLQDIPDRVVYEFIDLGGDPLANARVRAYRARGDGKSWYGKRYPAEPDLEKKADQDGRVVFDRTLWSRDGRIVHTFGHSNAVALLQITFEGKHYFLFEEVTDANLAFNLGHRDAFTFRRRIRLREGEPSPKEWDVNNTFEPEGEGFGKR